MGIIKFFLKNKKKSLLLHLLNARHQTKFQNNFMNRLFKIFVILHFGVEECHIYPTLKKRSLKIENIHFPQLTDICQLVSFQKNLKNRFNQKLKLLILG